MAAIRGLVAATVLIRATFDIAAAVARDTWRRIHITRATLSRHRRRSDLIPAHLRM